jgi:hypothetical protein
VLTAAWLGLMYGLVFYNMSGNSLDSIRNRINLLYGTVLCGFMLPYMSLTLYTSDKRIHMADTAAKRYRLSAYYAAKVCVEALSGAVSDSPGMCIQQHPTY